MSSSAIGPSILMPHSDAPTLETVLLDEPSVRNRATGGLTVLSLEGAGT